MSSSRRTMFCGSSHWRHIEETSAYSNPFNRLLRLVILRPFLILYPRSYIPPAPLHFHHKHRGVAVNFHGLFDSAPPLPLLRGPKRIIISEDDLRSLWLLLCPMWSEISVSLWKIVIRFYEKDTESLPVVILRNIDKYFMDTILNIYFQGSVCVWFNLLLNIIYYEYSLWYFYVIIDKTCNVCFQVDIFSL